jgi:hypothetical protein
MNSFLLLLSGEIIDIGARLIRIGKFNNQKRDGVGEGAAILLPSGKLIIRAVSTVSFLLNFCN